MKAFMLAAVLCLAAVPTAMAAPLDAFVDAYARDRAFSGSVLIQQGGKVRYAGSFGLASIAFEVPNDARTRYPIASITKLFASALILQLRDEGRLDLDRSVRTYLPDYRGEAADRVTVRQLLNHTSGLPGYDQVTDAASAIRDGMPVYQLPHDTDSLLARYASGKLVSSPGTKFEYNNADYIVLGKIVERLRGETFEQALRQYLLQPLGLRNSGMLRQDIPVPRLAETYFHRAENGPLTPDLPSYPENWYASGAMYATPADLLVFANALFGGKILSRDSMAQLLAPGLDDYGLGLWVYETRVDGRAHRVAKRPGRIMGAQTQLYRFLDCDITVIVLANTDAVDTDEFVASIGREVLRTADCADGQGSGANPSARYGAPARAADIPQAIALCDSNGSSCAPSRTMAKPAVSSSSRFASTSTRMLPASISALNLRRIGSGRAAPTSAEAQPPMIAPATVAAATPAQLMPSVGTSIAISPASRPVTAP